MNRGLKIHFRDERTNEGETFYYERGIIEFVQHLNRSTEAAHQDVVYIMGEYDGAGQKPRTWDESE